MSPGALDRCTPDGQSAATRSSTPSPSQLSLESKIERIEAKATAVADSDVQTCRLNPDFVHHNVRITLATLSAPETVARATAKARMTAADLEEQRADIADGAEVLPFLFQEARAEDPTAGDEQQVDDGFATREKLTAELRSATVFGVIPQEKVAKLPPIKSRSKVALGHHLVASAMLLKEYLPQLQGHTWCTLTWLDEVIAQGNRLHSDASSNKYALTANREHGPKAMRRDRVYTWLMGRYEEARGLLGFLYPGKVEEISPPLFSHKSVRAKAEAAKADEAKQDEARTDAAKADSTKADGAAADSAKPGVPLKAEEPPKDAAHPQPAPVAGGNGSTSHEVPAPS